MPKTEQPKFRTVGITFTNVKVSNPHRPDLGSFERRFLVDTGAIYSVLPASDQLRVVDQLVRACDARARHVGAARAERGEDLDARPLADPRADDRVQLAAARGAAAVVAEAVVARDLRLADRGAQAAEEAIARGPDDDPAVARFERVVRGGEGVLVADALGVDAEAGGDRRPRVGDGEDRVLVREVERARDAGPLPFEQCRHDTEREKEAADEIGERAAGSYRRAVGKAGHREESTRRLRDDVVRHLTGTRPGRAEPGERTDDEARVARAQHVGAEPFRRHPPGAEVVDDGVGAGDEAQEQLAAFRVADVERDRALAAVGVLKRERGLALRRGAVAVIVPSPRPLDLDHVGTEVGEERRRERPGDDAGEIEDAEAFENAPGHGGGS